MLPTVMLELALALASLNFSLIPMKAAANAQSAALLESLPTSLPRGYAVRTALRLAPPADRLRGRLPLLEDARIRDDVRDPIRLAWGGDPCDHPSTALLRPLCDAPNRTPLRPAIVRLVDVRGQPIAADTLPRPIGEISRARLYESSRRTYFISVDLSAGIGSYSGPLTRLAEPHAHGFGWLLATDSLAQNVDAISLVSTLKSGWRQSPRMDGRGEDLLLVACRPLLDSVAPSSRSPHVAQDSARFTRTFTRFTFVHGGWVRRSRNEPGCWENDDADSFPRRSEFP